MKKTVLTAAVLAASIRLALAADPAALSIVVFDEGQPVPRTEVLVDGKPQGVTDEGGSLRVTVPAGSRELVLRAEGREVLSLDLDFAEGERAELIASLQPDGPAHVQYESSQAGRQAQAQTQTPAGPPGTLAGRVVDSESGQPVANARVFVSGTPLDIRTDADGRFSTQVPEGTYSVSVIAAEFDSRSFDGVQIVAGETVNREIEVTPAGLELPEFVVLEPYIEGSLTALVEERRESASVADFLGAEQISRAGDSDAAGALKRVTGLTLVDGKYIYVRGLGERYSSVLLNGAQIPSPDPTRRVVPLDLFPTEVVDSILVQKTYSGEMPGDFGGGTIVLRTRSAPDGLLAKLGVTLGYLDGTTGEDGLTYVGGSHDWTGYDNRRGPQGAFGDFLDTGERLSNNLPAAQREAIGEALASHSSYTPFEKTIEPSYGFTGGLGYGWEFGDVKLGFLGAMRYDNSWDSGEEIRRTYVSSNQGLILNDDLDVDKTTQTIELSGFLNLSAEFGEHHQVRSTSLLARVTEDESTISQGVTNNENVRRTRLEWVENQLRSDQLGGTHTFPFLRNLTLDWVYTKAEASREAPNVREYDYDLASDGRYALSSRSGTFLQGFEDLIDNSDSYDVFAKLPLRLFGEKLVLTPNAGLSRLDRQRANESRTFNYSFSSIPSASRFLPLEQILTPENIGPGGITISESTLAANSYDAEQTLDAEYLAMDIEALERYRASLGMRREQNSQNVIPRNPLVDSAAIDEKANLPFVNLTWEYSDAAQLRFGYSETVSRPDFRELSPAPFIDPQLDIISFGNPDLVVTEIKNYDLRWEYYFSPDESVSAALFKKEFTNPIEKTQSQGGSGSSGTVDNADSATLDGIEFDLYKRFGFAADWPWVRSTWLDWVDWENVYVSANYARIESEISLSECGDTGFLTNCARPLQGQSPYVVNLQMGYIHPDGGREYSLLFNRFGRRIAQVGVAGADDIYEEPFDQLDFVLSQSLGAGFSVKLRLRNLLDPKVQFTQEDLPTREYRRGREALLTFQWTY